jgi:serine/threonine protein phosphatase PrpC
MKFHSAAITDIGKIREENEDRYLCDEALGLFGVADGIGGIVGGAEAAERTVQAISRSLPELGEQPDLVALTQAASASVRELGMILNPPYGIGSTLSFGVFKFGKLRLAHVGDSRVYVLKQGKLQCLTMDHSMQNEIHKLQARGERIELTSANRRALTRCMGQPGVPEVDYCELPVADGDRYLFTTDGIVNHLEESELATILAVAGGPALILDELVGLALQRGGLDNLTAVLVFIDQAK